MTPSDSTTTPRTARRLMATGFALLLALAFAAPAHAEDGGDAGADGEKQRGKRGKIFQKLDKNGDGQLTEDEVPERLWQRLVRADANGDGAVTKDEAKAARAKRGKKGKRAKRGARRGQQGRAMQRNMRLSRFDRDRDGTLSATELADAQMAITTIQAKGDKAGKRGRKGKRGKRKPGAAFKRFDKNEDGALTADEVPEKLWERLSKADANGDGQVTKDELKAAAEAKREARKGKRAPETPGEADEA